MAKKTFRMEDRDLFVKHAESGDIDALRQFIADGFPVNASNRDGYTGLTEAASRGLIEIAQLLLDSGANVNVTGFMRQTALHRAARRMDAAIVELLLDRGANPRIVDEDGNTAAHLWMKFSSIAAKPEGVPLVGFEHIERMLDAGLPINQCNHEGETLLHLSIYSSQDVQLIRRLLERGADPMMTDAKGDRAIHRAALGPRDDIFRFLVAERGMDVNDPNRYGNTPLHIANFTKTTATIFELGGNPNVQNNAGVTPFLMMVKSGNDRQFDELFHTYLDAGGDLTIADFEGNTVESVANKKKLVWVQKFLAARRANNAVDKVLKRPVSRP